MSKDPKKAIIEETGKCIGWVCMKCNSLYTSATYLAPTAEAADSAALRAATQCCEKRICACGADAYSAYADQCSKCWREEQDAKDRAHFDAAPKKTIAEYLTEHPDTFVSDGDLFWPIDCYVADEVYLRYPRVWFCEPLRGITLDADDVVSSWADERHEDAVDELDLAGLQSLLDDWCSKQNTVSWVSTGTALDPADVERLCREAAERDALEE